MITLPEALTRSCNSCPHPGGGHLPLAVTRFGRGACRDVHCGCARSTACNVEDHEIIGWVPYVGQPGCRYGLVVHRSDWRRRSRTASTRLG